MAETKRITVSVPSDLLRQAQRAAGMGIRETVREGLRRVVAAGAIRRAMERQAKWNVGTGGRRQRKGDRSGCGGETRAVC